MSTRGEPWGTDGPYKVLQATLRRLGLPKERLHALRAFFVTILLSGKVPVHVVRELVGHADLATTQGYAAILAHDHASMERHLDPASRAAAVGPVDDPLTPIHIAMLAGNWSAVAALLAAGANPDERSGEEQVPIAFEAIASDVELRIAGTMKEGSVALGDYGPTRTGDLDPRAWSRLARRLVVVDDDVPLERLWKCTLQRGELGPPEMTKAFAFLQFLFEGGEDDARRCVEASFRSGTPEAAQSVFRTGLDALDARYRDWILRSW